jgi:hypothetical protein
MNTNYSIIFSTEISIDHTKLKLYERVASENAFNFQNRFGNVNSYTPIRKYGGTGGFVMELTDKEIERYRKGGFIIEEID